MHISKTNYQMHIWYEVAGQRFDTLESALSAGGSIREVTYVTYTVTLEHAGRVYHNRGLRYSSQEKNYGSARSASPAPEDHA